jgi:hypothetical protein
MMCEADTMGNRFPILVNDNVRRMDVECGSDRRIHVRIFDAGGEKEFERWF